MRAKRQNFAAGFLVLIASLAATDSGHAAFNSGVESFSGTTIDTATWQAYPDVQSLSQNNGLTIDTRYTLPTTPKVADLTTKTVTIGVGQSVSVVASILERTSNGNTPTLLMFLTTNSEGVNTPTGNDTHWLAIQSHPNTIADLIGVSGGGSGHTLVSHPQPLGEPYTFRIDRVSQTSAAFSIFDSHNILLGGTTESFSGMPSNLFISLQTNSILGQFQSVTIGTAVPEPACALSVATALGYAMIRRRRRYR